MLSYLLKLSASASRLLHGNSHIGFSSAMHWVVVFSACLFGLIHLYQGPVGASWTTIFGLIMALYYLWFGRAVPLILAHYLTNALQVVVFAILAR